MLWASWRELRKSFQNTGCSSDHLTIEGNEISNILARSALNISCHRYRTGLWDYPGGYRSPIEYNIGARTRQTSNDNFLLHATARTEVYLLIVA